MSLRALWVIGADGRVVFSRRFRTVERRARQLGGTSWHALPLSDAEFAARVLRETAPAEQDAIERCDTVNVDPVYHFPDMAGPLVITSQDGYVYVGAPLIELSAQDPRLCTSALEKMPSVTITLCLLKELARVVLAVKDMGPNAVCDAINDYAHAALPLGTVTVVAADVTTALGSPEASMHRPQPERRQPAWRPAPPPPSTGGRMSTVGRGTKGVLHLHVHEFVRAVQYDDATAPDICEVFGRVHCKADVEDVPEFTIALTSSSGVESMVTHAAVQSLEPAGLGTTVNLTHRLRFVPPSSEFELCGYKMCSTTIRLPVRGFFQMKALNRKSTRILIQLKLEDGLPNTFEFCDVRLPFPGRLIDSIDGSPTSGALSVSPSGGEVVWNLGHKWKTREIAAPLTVTFKSTTASDAATVDPFLTGDNGCLHVRFKMPNFTMSDSKVDPNSLTYTTSGKIKLNTTRHFAATDYKIWNSLGKSRRCLPPEQLVD
eukprot:m.36945 g.36945  ORF g.36945 m.36945 type:complete len:488 (-) comp5456_c0_seq1:165-1628(-)